MQMPTVDPSFAVRVMRPEDVELIHTWATAEGWNPGLHDGPCFFATDPGGFFVGELADKPVACISCVAYHDSFGFLGQYIVKPEFRGQGYGLLTWQAGMAHLGTRSVEGFKIGPLFADDLAACELLLRGLLAETGGVFCLDVPEEAENPGAGQLVGRFGMRELFRTARMYTRGWPQLDAGRVFGITTMELG
jgi:GNAT superfamily N-acetyltransferase